MLAYHDREWGVPAHDDRLLFELLTLEGAQAGLSWSTILRKRDGYRAAFSGFDPARVARYDSRKVERLLRDPGIVRNRLKVESTVSNAKRVLEVQQQLGSFDAYVWEFVGGTPRDGRRRRLGDLPAADGGVAGDEQGPQAPRLPLRRADRLLRLHAGGRAGQRPRDGVLPLPRDGAG